MGIMEKIMQWLSVFLNKQETLTPSRTVEAKRNSEERIAIIPKTKEEVKQIDRSTEIFYILYHAWLEGHQNLNFAVNAISEKYAKFLPDKTAYAIMETRKEGQKLAKQDTRLAEDYFYKALSAQWLKSSKKLIDNAGGNDTVWYDGKMISKLNYAPVEELLRQTIWTSKSVVTELMDKHGITKKEVSAFLIHLATDDIEYNG